MRLDSLKVRIIITFLALTVLMIVLLAVISYRYSKDLYLDQLRDQVLLMTDVAAQRLSPADRQLIDLGAAPPESGWYFDARFEHLPGQSRPAEIFIFDSKFRIIKICSERNTSSMRSLRSALIIANTGILLIFASFIDSSLITFSIKNLIIFRRAAESTAPHTKLC